MINDNYSKRIDSIRATLKQEGAEAEPLAIALLEGLSMVGEGISDLKSATSKPSTPPWLIGLFALSAAANITLAVVIFSMRHDVTSVEHATAEVKAAVADMKTSASQIESVANRISGVVQTADASAKRVQESAEKVHSSANAIDTIGQKMIEISLKK